MKQIKSCKTRELSSLDDWSLLKLLDQVPLTDLIRLGQVNHRFNQLVKRSCRQPVRRHLVLVVGSERASNCDDHHNTITLKQLNRTAVEAILVLLPRTASLKIIYHGNILDEMIYLLEGWADQLVVLELLLTKTIHSEWALFPLFCLFNRITQLKQLHIKDQFFPNNQAPIHLPIISQLQAFTFKVQKSSLMLHQLLDQLRLYATNTLTEINLKYNFNFNRQAIDQLLLMPSHVALAYKELSLGNAMSELSFHRLVVLCQKYPNINQLCIWLRIDEHEIIKLNHTLVMWNKLTHLILYVSTNIFQRVESVDSRQLVPLPSVTSLKLTLFFGKYDHLELLHLGVIFPNLIKLNVNIIECLACGFKWSNVHFKLKRHCLKHHLQAKVKFSQLLPKLTSVILWGDDAIDKILPEKDWKPLKPSPLPKTCVLCAVNYVRRIPERLRNLAQETFRRVRQGWF